jgi:hypothetical protein
MEKDTLPLPGIEPRFLGYPASKLVDILTATSPLKDKTASMKFENQHSF